MKSNLKSKILILIILGILFAFSPIFINNLRFTAGDRNITSNCIDDFDHNNLQISPTSGKIYINGNSGWLDFSNAGNCTGTGTYDDPYVIEDLIIDAEEKGDCIYIGNSNVHFVIRNCTLTNAGPNSVNGGVKLENCENGVLINNTFSFNLGMSTAGIQLLDSIDITISENKIISNEYGIYCHSNYVTISENDFRDNNVGMRIYSSSLNRISNNNVTNSHLEGIFIYKGAGHNIVENHVLNNRGGISLLETNDNNILRNTVMNNRGNGIGLIKSNTNRISANTINNNVNGIMLSESCSNNIIEMNQIYNAGKFGILLKKTGIFNWIWGNIIDKCGLGLEGSFNQISTHYIGSSNLVNAKPLYYYVNASGLDTSNFLNAGQVILVNCRDSIIASLAMDRCSRGIAIHFSHKITIINNIVTLNSEEGIYLQNSSENIIIRNLIYRNKIGIKFDFNCNYNNIIDNTVNENRYFGILLYFYCTHNTISNNGVNKNIYRGINIVFSNMNIIKENIVKDNGNQGIKLEFSDLNDVASNIVDRTNGTGINLVYSDSNQIYNNIVNHNIIGIELYSSDTNIINFNILNGNNHCITEWECENNTILGNFCSTYKIFIGFEFGTLFFTGLFCIISITLIREKKKIKTIGV
ncbi:MAG: nitrous oxide reductase family maturation protein NosD [Candidatus Hodarchaeota archaeon]